MADISGADGLGSPPIEQDPSIAQIQSQQLGTQSRLQVSLPATGFVASIDGLTGQLTFSDGTFMSVTNDGVGNFTFSVVGISTAAGAQSKVTNVPPTPGNDESEGYSQFSQWIDTSGPALYECLDASTMTAVWRRIDILPDSGWTAVTGTPSKAGFDTSTVTLTQVAETLMAIQQALLANGNLTP